MKFSIPDIDRKFYDLAKMRLDNLTKPVNSLGKLEEYARRMVAITGKLLPEIPRKVVCVFAGDHGVVEEGVSAYPKDVTYQMVYNFLRGGAAINVLSRLAKAECMVVDVGVDFDFGNEEGLIRKKVLRGTRNFLKGPAMEREDAIRCIEAGYDVAKYCREQGFNLFVPGDMGIGNTTPSSAVIAALLGEDVEKVVGRGTGIDDEKLKRKIEVIRKGIETNRPRADDPVDVLSKVGGCEIGAICGFILGACEDRIPIVLDGLISCAGALLAYKLEPKVKEFLFAGHKSREKGQSLVLKEIGIEPILDLDMALGEGTGGILGSIILEASVRLYREMATFDEASVSKSLE